MPSNTEDRLEEAIKSSAKAATSATKSEDALRYTQAALNAAHTIQVLRQARK